MTGEFEADRFPGLLESTIGRLASEVLPRRPVSIVGLGGRPYGIPPIPGNPWVLIPGTEGLLCSENLGGGV